MWVDFKALDLASFNCRRERRNINTEKVLDIVDMFTLEHDDHK